jgi:hypothetical protein
MVALTLEAEVRLRLRPRSTCSLIVIKGPVDVQQEAVPGESALPREPLSWTWGRLVSLRFSPGVPLAHPRSAV